MGSQHKPETQQYRAKALDNSTNNAVMGGEGAWLFTAQLVTQCMHVHRAIPLKALGCGNKELVRSRHSDNVEGPHRYVV